MKRFLFINLEQFLDPIEGADALVFVEAEVPLRDEEQLVFGVPFVPHEGEADLLREYNWNALRGKFAKKSEVVQHKLSNKSDVLHLRLWKATGPSEGVSRL